MGNEHADEVAKAAAKGRAPAAELHQYDVPSGNSRTDLYWPVETVESNHPNTPTADAPAEEDEEEGVIVCKEGKHNRWMTRADAERAVRNDITGKTYILNDVASPSTSEAKEPMISKRPLENLKGDLKKLSHKRCRLGQANRNPIYFEAWARTSGDRDEHASSRYMTNSSFERDHQAWSKEDRSQIP